MALRPSVIAKFPAFTQKFEGREHQMYADVIGLITIGMGNLIDPVGAALVLPFVDAADGHLASSGQIRAEWTALKRCAADRAFCRHSTAVQARLAGLTLRLTDEAIDALVLERLNAGAAALERNHFPSLESYPADAQLALCSLGWAAGFDWPRKFPHAKAAILARDWAHAAVEAVLADHTKDGTPNPGVIPRNDAQKICFANAAAVDDGRLDPAVCYWPAFPYAPGVA